MEDASIVCSIAWVRKGYAKKFPTQFQMSQVEAEQLNQDPEIYKKKKEMDVENLDDYDENDNLPVFAAETHEGFQRNGDDQYPMYFEDDSEEEKEDYTLKDTDALIIAGKIEKNEFSGLEVYVFDETSNNLYVHHDITLSAFPLSIEWLSIQPSSFQSDSHKKGNFAVIGSFLPEIEIWDIDVLDVIEPTMVLGGTEEVAAKKSKKGPKSFKSKTVLKPDSHEDAVLSVHLNGVRKEILASGSADSTVKLWDLSKGKCVMTYKHHGDKVQSVKWNPKEQSVLLSGSFDRTIQIFDAMQNQDSVSVKIQSDIEHATWDPLNASLFYVSMEDGSFVGYDARKASEPLFSVQAHNKATTSIATSYGVSGMVATCSLDGMIKLWDTQTINNEGEPLLVIEKNFKAGKLNCSSFYEDNPWLATFGTNRGELVVWDVRENQQVEQYFANRVVAAANH